MIKVKYWIIAVLAAALCSCSSSASGSEPKQNSVTPVPDNSEKDAEYRISDIYLDLYNDSIGNYYYYAYAEITNTGSVNIHLDSCRFIFEDKSGNVYKVDEYAASAPDIIKPGEKGYFYTPSTQSLDTDTAKNKDLTITAEIVCEKYKDEVVEYELSNMNMRKDAYEYPIVTGRVLSSTKSTSKYIYLNAFFYDDNNQLLFITEKSVEAQPGGSVAFEINSMYGEDSNTRSKATKYKVIARDRKPWI